MGIDYYHNYNDGFTFEVLILAMTLDEIISNIYEKINENVKKSRFENALNLISLSSDILYNYNQIFYSNKLENTIEYISFKLLNKTKIRKLDINTVLFYDGFGLDTRGLAQIYIRALVEKFKVIYICKDNRINRIPIIKKLVLESGGEVVALPSNNNIDAIYELKSIVDCIKPGSIFMYAYPSDVIIPTILHHYKGVINSYQINLTDHAFWLGAKAFDYCIEFRDYGAFISNKYRNIDKNRIKLLPFYPIIDYEQEFLGYPFEYQKDKKIIFSGGSLYKTFGGNGEYYKIVRYILKNHKDIIFWYAGSGDKTEIVKLINDYPNRVFITEERKDLYQVLEHCYFYLSTYPLFGGLMLQYAAMAKKLPITLRTHNLEGFLINQEKYGFIFDSCVDLCNMVDKLIDDEEYTKIVSSKLDEAVIKPEDFNKDLYKIVVEQESNHEISYKEVDVSKFLEIFYNQFDETKLCDIIASHRKVCVFKNFPLLFTSGVVKKIKRKICSYIN